MDHNSVYGRFRVDPTGLQIAHKMLLFQWQDGQKVIVWPEELAPGKAALPDAAVESAPVSNVAKARGLAPSRPGYCSGRNT
ncbi:MAG TPA: hypothetical protein VLG10_16680 [Methylomirabilota bacterium]|nr:hypothetical protein [Methylomirabilota bacterium]